MVLSPPRIRRIDDTLLDETVLRAQNSARLRTNHNFHQDATDNPHRFLNALARGTYCAPHRHVTPPKSETFLVLRGRVALFTFDDRGDVLETYRLGEGGLHGVDLDPGVWHSIAVLSDTAVCFEVKPGPWEPASDKDFASFAPREGDPKVPAYLASLLARVA